LLNPSEAAHKTPPEPMTIDKRFFIFTIPINV